jgi:uncharacterized membrane protein required for colicin V production
MEAMFNIFDVVVLGVLLLGAYAGSQVGILASVFYVASGFAGLSAAERFARGSNIKFYLVFVAVAAAVIGTGFLLARLFKKIFLGTLDRVAGALLGIVLGVVVTATVLLPLTRFLSARGQEKAAASYTVSHALPRLYEELPQLERFKPDRLPDIFPVPEIPRKFRMHHPRSTVPAEK